MAKLSILKQFMQFLIARKRYWLIPIIVIVFVIGLLIVFAETSALAPFIYTLF
jgi:hypothetical protein